MRVFLKIVPDNEPNGDGEWIEAEVPRGFKVFDLVPLAEHHVVAVKRFHDPRDGGPMHLMGSELPPAPYQFEASWLSKSSAQSCAPARKMRVESAQH